LIKGDTGLTHLNVPRASLPYASAGAQKWEIAMSGMSERAVSDPYPAVANGEAEATKLNQRALEFMLGAQKMMLEEMMFFNAEVLERTRTETHLFSEFAAKMAGARSVKDIKTMYQECGQHQLDFFRRETERLFTHGERMITATSNLIEGSAN
jgi:hypothetical protein